MNIQTAGSLIVDLATIKIRQQVRVSGDCAVIGTTVEIVGERLCEVVEFRIRQRVLDVAAGNGNATLAAALAADIYGLLDDVNVAADSTLVIPSDDLAGVIIKKLILDPAIVSVFAVVLLVTAAPIR